MKGLGTITREINKYVKKFGIHTSYGAEFLWWVDTCEIEWTLLTTDQHDILFKDFMETKLGLKYECDIFLLSLFHEIGHFMTEDSLTITQQLRSAEIKNKLEEKGNLTDDDYIKYYGLPDEIKASKWAVNYINNNAKEVEDFWNNVQKKILDFYEKNELSIFS